MIVVTGAAGFIASNLIARLNAESYYDLVLVDDFSCGEKQENYCNKKYTSLVHRNDFGEWLHNNHRFVQLVFHLGARTNTTEFDPAVFDLLNLNYSKFVFGACAQYGIPLIYASSAACYGDGELGYSDADSISPLLKPLNPYGVSKLEFDKWVLQQDKKPGFWAGFRFFNVYGPNEYHKGRMASVVMHAYNQIRKSDKIQLFRSHRPDIEHGEQKRDFIYVKDAVDVLFFFMIHRKHSGIYNLGTGQSASFNQLAKACFESCKKPLQLEFVDTPADIRDKYQYYTCADITKLREAGYGEMFTPIEKGVHDYIASYLKYNRYA